MSSGKNRNFDLSLDLQRQVVVIDFRLCAVDVAFTHNLCQLFVVLGFVQLLDARQVELPPNLDDQFLDCFATASLLLRRKFRCTLALRILLLKVAEHILGVVIVVDMHAVAQPD